MSIPLLSVQDLVKNFALPRRSLIGPRGAVQAVSGVSFELERGKTLGLVGESGSGKSTTARLITGLTRPTSGRIEFDGVDVATASRRQRGAMRRRMQMVFQDPRGSLDPRMRVRDVIGEGLVVHRIASGAALRARVEELLSIVGLQASDADKYAHEFSGGQAQRIAIARALATDPELIVCDEAVSALDVSVQAQILNLLRRLQDELQLTYLFISHDLNVVRYMSDEVIVMYLGRSVERGPAEAVFERPTHPYTQALLGAVSQGDWTEPEPTGPTLRGEIPSPANPPSGCRFHTRCPLAFDRCRVDVPDETPLGGGHLAACHLATEVMAR
ncbi:MULTISPECIES: oligopeptide/dipeptide ABC transporter ATP-binding protein [unclassified Microbacterium]|uniref:ABC transporter ATP-binding protein n=1 Tax=unclassified Microbacterium TaxID=2609290 RepID=UPI00214BAA15|nr:MULTISPECIES: oligopeptide/dipeptide ABC transporter ATP-binding protein [unclassified Microbacterium]MCR2808393.1 ATP-binding cassette domain-containing protein [Microbacterium sp. zg.B185]WIM19161.1 ATP-binding cassette domain-containing protein [Microbacterium sp. zg-B185]